MTEKKQSASLRYYYANKEKVLAKKKQYRKDNREKVLAVQKRHRDANREKLNRGSKSYKAANKDKVAASQRARRLRQLGWTEADYLKALEDQENRCAICLSEFQEGKVQKAFAPCADHCHSTGKARAVICRNCNVALGLFNDNPERMEHAARYVRKFAEMHRQCEKKKD